MRVHPPLTQRSGTLSLHVMNPRTSATPETALESLRRILMAILLFGLVGITFELFLIGHTEGAWEWVPIALLIAGLPVTALAWIRPSRRSVRLLQLTMLLFLASGLVGLYLHYHGNVEFELEMTPSLGGLSLIWEALSGATPTLAPGTMLLLALLGLAVTFRHPALPVKHPENPNPADTP